MGGMQKFLLNMVLAGGVLGALVQQQTGDAGGMMQEEEAIVEQFNAGECQGACQIQGQECNEDALIDDEVQECLMALSECLVGCDDSAAAAAGADFDQGAGGGGGGLGSLNQGQMNQMLDSVKRQVCKTNCGVKGRECTMVSMNEQEAGACEAATDMCIANCVNSADPDPNVPDLNPKELVQKGY